MSVQWVDEIRVIMQDKSRIISLLKDLTKELVHKDTPKLKAMRLHKQYKDLNAQIEQLDKNINVLVEKINKSNSRELNNILNYKEVYNSDTFGEKISDISTKVRNEYLTIMNMDRKLIKELYEINRGYDTIINMLN